MSETIGRTKEIANAIGQETDEHLNLLTDIESGVDRTTGKLKNTTKRVERVQVKSDLKCMYCTICILILALVGVVFAAVYTQNF